MSHRINIQQTTPAAFQAMLSLEKFIATSGLDPVHKELIKIRASQINGCAFCIDMHTKEARKIGFTEQRIYLLNAWKETDLYDEKEKAILAIIEEITLISNGGVSQKNYEAAAAHFSPEYLSAIIMMAVTINAWNRIAITTELPVQHD
ncbi:carboxymuconolactone decarboxylase family protein [Flavobacterium silvaticum]|nr:carboxymuconolactone decarboxylase family protein [Flavobacterium silvaticum]